MFTLRIKAQTSVHLNANFSQSRLQKGQHTTAGSVMSADRKHHTCTELLKYCLLASETITLQYHIWWELFGLSEERVTCAYSITLGVVVSQWIANRIFVMNNNSIQKVGRHTKGCQSRDGNWVQRHLNKEQH